MARLRHEPLAENSLNSAGIMRTPGMDGNLAAHTVRLSIDTTTVTRAVEEMGFAPLVVRYISARVVVVLDLVELFQVQTHQPLVLCKAVRSWLHHLQVDGRSGGCLELDGGGRGSLGGDSSRGSGVTWRGNFGGG